jgi:hypothetical protein
MLSPSKDAFGHTSYERHHPEQALLYQLAAAHYPALVDQLAQQGKSLPDHVHREFEAYLRHWQINFSRSRRSGVYVYATALLHSPNALILRSR